MPRPNTGPRLKLEQPDKYAKPYWFIVWYERGVKRRKPTGCGQGDLEGAQAKLAEFIGQRLKPSGPRGPDQMTVETAISLYAKEHAPQTAAPERIAFALEPILAWWGDKPVSAIRGETCRRYARERTRTVKRGDQLVQVPIAPATVRRELGALAAALEHCRREGYLLNPPAVVLPGKTRSKERWLTRQEAARLLRACRKVTRGARLYLPLFVLVGLYMGARKEAILSLQWQPNTAGGWVDLDQGVIDFRAPSRGATKKRRVKAKIPDRLLTFLRLARPRTRQYVIEHNGKMIADIKKAFNHAAELAGMPEVTPHTLRHTAITWRVQKGVPLWEVAGFVGTSPQMIERVYGHHSPDHQERARNAY